MSDEQTIIRLTDHAIDRAKERFGWNKDTLYRMAEKAFTEGIKHKDTKSHLSKYITKLWFEHKHSNNTRIYGENIYFFATNTLCTVYHIPNHLRKQIKYAKKDKKPD
jgi:hypothetical protein